MLQSKVKEVTEEAAVKEALPQRGLKRVAIGIRTRSQDHKRCIMSTTGSSRQIEEVELYVKVGRQANAKVTAKEVRVQ